MPDTLQDIAQSARAWPFEEAGKLLKRIGGATPAKGHVLFETGYGPSGLPHIGTFGEVVRTTMVRRAFEVLAPDIPTRLICVSDDLDGLRKVPDNIPEPDRLRPYVEEKNAAGQVIKNGSPLSFVPDPFQPHDSGLSYAAENNRKLRVFLDSFGFDYEFLSSTECYRSGRFDDTLLRILERLDRITPIATSILSEARKKTYAPFLPIVERDDPFLGMPRLQVLHQAVIRETDPARGRAVFQEVDDDGAPLPGAEPFDWPVTGGHCKMQWRPDWAMRWVALGVDYEMSGKDLIDSVRISSKIVRALDATPPEGLTYELFLDEHGQKISKSKGNGIAVEQWLRYAPSASLALYMFQKPRAAKRLYFDVIPKAVDEYLTFLEKFRNEAPEKQIENPVWHIHEGAPPADRLHAMPVSFGLLLNLASAANAHDKTILWGFISRYAPEASPETAPFLDALAGHAIAYYEDFVQPAKRFRAPNALERAALQDLEGRLAALPADADAETIQTEIYSVGKEHPFEHLRDWFRGLYETLLGQSAGPRFGSFVALYGIAETRTLIAKALAGELAPDG